MQRTFVATLALLLAAACGRDRAAAPPAATTAAAAAAAEAEAIARIQVDVEEIDRAIPTLECRVMTIEGPGAGGELTACYAGDNLLKIIANHLDDRGALIEEFWMHDTMPVFVHVRHATYTRPNSAELRDKVEDAYYLRDGRLVRHVRETSGPDPAPAVITAAELFARASAYATCSRQPEDTACAA